MAQLLFLPNLILYTLLFQKYLMFFALTWTDLCIWYFTNQLKNGGFKKMSPNNLQTPVTLLDYVICLVYHQSFGQHLAASWH